MSDAAIRVAGVGKMYKIFSGRGGNLVDSLGLARVLPERLTRHQEFWALRGIDLEVPRGSRLGIIGRNGAGKTTLLKLITGNLAPTEGTLEVRGQVQSLLDAGGGLHPEFSGRENIHAALTYLGLSSGQIEEVEADIVDFTELGDFIDRPFKTYSLGMQARLSFTIATSIRPEILVVDEMLGAGDAYFFGKSTARMHELVAGGATVLIVTHALDQVLRFCEEAIWIDRGQIVARGEALDVTKAYEKFVRVLEDRRLRGKNVKVASRRFKGLQSEGYADTVQLRVTVTGPPGSACDVQEAALYRESKLEDRVLVGSPQDGDTSQSSFVELDRGAWGPPVQEENGFLRTLRVPAGGAAEGLVKVFCWAFEGDQDYTAELRYRTRDGAGATLDVIRGSQLLRSEALPAAPSWRVERVATRPEPEPAAIEATAPGPAGHPAAAEDGAGADPVPVTIANLSRWEGEGSLRIESVAILGHDGRETAVLTASRPARVKVVLRARAGGDFPLYLASLVFTLDGIVATRHVSPLQELRLDADQATEAELDLGDLRLGNGYYLLSVGLYRRLDLDDIEQPELYDYRDRSYEFQVVGNPRLHNELFRHPGEWRLSVPTLSRPGTGQDQ